MTLEKTEYSGRRSLAEIEPFSVCPEKNKPFVSPQKRSLFDFPPSSEMIFEQRRAVSILMRIGCQEADDVELPELPEFPEPLVAKRRMAVAARLSPALSRSFCVIVMRGAWYSW